jgi:hypothetical protein
MAGKMGDALHDPTLAAAFKPRGLPIFQQNNER